MSDELADNYDRNRQADIDAVTAFLPQHARIIEARGGMVTFEVRVGDTLWVGQMCRTESEGWVYRK